MCVQIERAREVINKQDISRSSFLSPVKSRYINAFVFAYLTRLLPLLPFPIFHQTWPSQMFFPALYILNHYILSTL